MKNPYPQWFTDNELAQAIRQYDHSEKMRDGRHSLPIIKLIMADDDGVHCTWLISEVDPHELDEAYGLIDQGLGLPEPSFLSLRKLSRLRNSEGFLVKRVENFCANGNISAYAAAARLHGSIVEISP